MTLYIKDGKLLVSDGKLAVHNRCCCGGTCSDFPGCYLTNCTITVSGFLNSDTLTTDCCLPQGLSSLRETISYVHLANINGVYAATRTGSSVATNNVFTNPFGVCPPTYLKTDIGYDSVDFRCGSISGRRYETFAFLTGIDLLLACNSGTNKVGVSTVSNPRFHLIYCTYDTTTGAFVGTGSSSSDLVWTIAGSNSYVTIDACKAGTVSVTIPMKSWVIVDNSPFCNELVSAGPTMNVVVSVTLNK